MTTIQDLHEQWLSDPEYREEFDRLGDEFAVAQSLIGARVSAGLTQAEVVQRMNTTQSTIARLEGGKGNPSTSTLKKFAQTTGKTTDSICLVQGWQTLHEATKQFGVIEVR